MRSAPTPDPARAGWTSRTPRWRPLAGPLEAAGAAATGGVAVLLRDPHQPGSWGWCPMHQLTGLACPFCGGLRAVWDLEHGRFAAAVASDALVVALLPGLLLGWLVWVQRCRRAAAPVPAPVPSGRSGLALAVLVVAFAVARNLPGLPLGP